MDMLYLRSDPLLEEELDPRREEPPIKSPKRSSNTSENADEVFKRMEEEGIDPVIFGLSDKDFQLLAKNFAQIRAKLQETNTLLEEYKKYYEEYETDQEVNNKPK